MSGVFRCCQLTYVIRSFYGTDRLISNRNYNSPWCSDFDSHPFRQNTRHALINTDVGLPDTDIKFDSTRFRYSITLFLKFPQFHPGKKYTRLSLNLQ